MSTIAIAAPANRAVRLATELTALASRGFWAPRSCSDTVAERATS
jgi:hypothetical protein